MCMCVYGFISFVIDLHFFHIFFMFMFIYLFVLIYISSDWGIIHSYPYYASISKHMYVANVIISPTCGVHCNTCCSKSTIQKLGFFSWFHYNQWWTCVIDYWRQLAWSSCAYDTIWNLGFASSKTSSIPHFNLHS
jgi:hypothetical protein